jgi:hopene-associated glycosyltransferase HpnB
VIVHVLAAVPLFIWLYLLVARASFWRASVSLSALSVAAQPILERTKVVAVIPARDEAQVLGDTVQSLLRQEPDGSLHIIVVDDASADGTARVAQEAAAALNASDRLQVLAGTPLPAGWTGKLWAMNQGIAAAALLDPDYLLLTDADIHHEPGNVASLVAVAQAHDCDLVSSMVQLSVNTVAEKCLIPAFVFFFLML